MNFKPQHILIAALTALAACSCSDEPRPGAYAAMPLVVEAWIEDGGHPVVILTRAIDLTGNIESLDSFVEKWCRVSVDDGNRKVYLNGKIDRNYVPSYIYTTSRLTGRVGGSYTLTIETETDTFSAVTSIRPYTGIDSVRVSRCIDNDTLYRITAFPHVDTSPGSYYKFFTKVGRGERRYYSSFLGTFEGQAYDSRKGINVTKGIHDTYSGTDHFTPYFCLGDTVTIKLCTLQPETFEFWTAYENIVSMSTNLFFTTTQSCPSNIPGCKGYWAGYGTSFRSVIITDPNK